MKKVVLLLLPFLISITAFHSAKDITITYTKFEPILKNMKSIIFILVILFSFSFYSSAQIFTDRKKIYELVIETFVSNKIPIINETFTRIYRFDIDGNYDKWFYPIFNQESSDTSILVGRTVCVVPIEYSRSVISFLDSQNIVTAGLANRTDNIQIDSLKNYISDERIISWKKAPLGNSTFGNIFKKRRVVGLSSILFDEQNKIAVVKIQVYARNRLRSKNPSIIIILNKVGMDWKVISSLDEKYQ